MRQAVAQCRVSGDDAAWLAGKISDLLDDWERGDRADFETAFELNLGSLLKHRDDCLREAHRRHFANLPLMSAARKIEKIARELRRRPSTIDPTQIALDDPKRLIAEAIVSWGDIPKTRRLFDILGMQ
jgi:hypothetical protein